MSATIENARAPSHRCTVWSAHAADLAELVAADLGLFSDGPAARSSAIHREAVRLRVGTWAHRGSVLSMPDRAVALGCALGDDLSPDLVIAGLSAAWVCCGGEPPDTVELVTVRRPVPLAGVTMREAQLRSEDVEAIGGCPVTVPERTAEDILRFCPADAVAHRAIAALLASGHTSERAVARRLGRLSPVPYRRRALDRWRRVTSTS